MAEARVGEASAAVAVPMVWSGQGTLLVGFSSGQVLLPGLVIFLIPVNPYGPGHLMAQSVEALNFLAGSLGRWQPCWKLVYVQSGW